MDGGDRGGSAEFSSFILLSPDDTVCYTRRSSAPQQNNRTEQKKKEKAVMKHKGLLKTTGEQNLSGSCNRRLLHPFFVSCYKRSDFSLKTL
jgi:hypothetical protein